MMIVKMIEHRAVFVAWIRNDRAAWHGRWFLRSIMHPFYLAVVLRLPAHVFFGVRSLFYLI